MVRRSGRSALFWTVAAVLVLREWLGLIGLTGRRADHDWVAGSAADRRRPGTMAEYRRCLSRSPGVRPWLGAGVVAAASRPARGCWAAAGVLYAAVIPSCPSTCAATRPTGSWRSSGSSPSSGSPTSAPISPDAPRRARSSGRASARRRHGRASSAASSLGRCAPLLHRSAARYRLLASAGSRTAR